MQRFFFSFLQANLAESERQHLLQREVMVVLNCCLFFLLFSGMLSFLSALFLSHIDEEFIFWFLQAILEETVKHLRNERESHIQKEVM